MNRRNVFSLIISDPNLMIGVLGLLGAAGLVGAILLGVTP
jgi:hypothetical protein